ncbi:Tetratricopeptide repeat-containing protein [Pseudomonas flavescens]|uniref:Tetratricopeptide repeat-containing protein n=1 Tax=Phytopseudomonas flavescens TaxID=29435 RepID=A0A1G8KEG3_9GAMM|nr:tetratricopeptide repeat protein [Pseudomonas flavescens]SDI41817.1 Tetratricopeptide repeat-containing protein [Pseudomonas flavescens]
MFYALIVALVVVPVILLWRSRHSAPTETISAAHARLVELDAQLMDPHGVFSISETLAELDDLENQLPGDAAADRGHLLYLRSFVLHRAGRPWESLPMGLEALRIDDARAFLSPQQRGPFAHSLATQAQDLGEWSTAIDTYGAALVLLDADPDMSEAQRLGVRKRLAYCLHEAQRYTEALEINSEVLAGAERLVGSHDDRLLPVITNLAQNTHALGQLHSARTFLERRLEIAHRHDIADEVDDSLFQLGVLAFESGNAEEAEAFMTRRLEQASASGDEQRLAQAREDFDALYQKLGRQAAGPSR